MLGSQNYSKIIAKTWSDPAFRKKFLGDPKTVLREYGIEIPDSVQVSVKEGSGSGRIDLELPPRPANSTDNDLQKLADAFRCF